MSTQGIVRFQPNGPAGLGRLEDMPSEMLVTPTPVQRGHSYLEVAELGLSAGVWDCTPVTTKPGPYPVHEFMLVLEGAVTIVETGGRETTVRAGESFILPKGLECAWKQTEYMRKFYVIFDDPSGAAPADPSALSVISVDPRAAMEPMAVDPAPIVGPVPKQHVRSWFADPTGQWTVGTWDAEPFERKVLPFPRYELMHLLEGSVTLVDGRGHGQTFRAGDTFLVPMGEPCAWKSTEYVRKIYCIFKPSEAAAAALRA